MTGAPGLRAEVERGGAVRLTSPGRLAGAVGTSRNGRLSTQREPRQGQRDTTDGKGAALSG